MDQYYIWSFPGTGKSSVPPSVPGVLDADSRLYQFIGATPRTPTPPRKPVPPRTRNIRTISKHRDDGR